MTKAHTLSSNIENAPDIFCSLKLDFGQQLKEYYTMLFCSLKSIQWISQPYAVKGLYLMQTSIVNYNYFVSIYEDNSKWHCVTPISSHLTIKKHVIRERESERDCTWGGIKSIKSYQMFP